MSKKQIIDMEITNAQEWYNDLVDRGVVKKILQKVTWDYEKRQEAEQIILIYLWENVEKVYENLVKEDEKLVTGGEKVGDRVQKVGDQGEKVGDQGEKVGDRLRKLGDRYISGMVFKQVRSYKSDTYNNLYKLRDKCVPIEHYDVEMEDNEDEEFFNTKYNKVLEIMDILEFDERDRDILFTLSETYHHNEQIEELMEKHNMSRRNLEYRWAKLKERIRAEYYHRAKKGKKGEIIMYDYASNVELGRYKNLEDCYQQTGINTTSISKIIKGQNKTAKYLENKKVFFRRNYF